MEELTKMVAVRVTPSLKAEITRIAQKRKMKEADVIRMLMQAGAEAHADMEKIGLIGVVDFLYFIREAIKEKSKGKQLSFV